MRASAGAAARIVGLLAVVAVVFGGAWAVGAQVAPILPGPAATTAGHDSGHGDVHAKGGDEQSEDGDSGLPGLAVAAQGHRLVLAEPVVEPGNRVIAFTIEGPDAQPVTDFDLAHGKRLHLIAVRRDHSGYQHLHPVLDARTGLWSTRVTLTPGAWRVFADFTPSGGPAVVLGTDLLVPGGTPRPAATAETRSDVADGHEVAVEGHLQPGEHSRLALRVSDADGPVTDLQPYLGAYGHLVALREGDLAYLHVHPAGEPGDGSTPPGPEVEFVVEVPSAGRYHLYLDFRRGGVVRTAHLVLDAGGHEGHAP